VRGNIYCIVMRKWMTYLLIFIVGFIGVSIWSFWIVIHPPQINIGASPEDYSLPYEEVSIKTKDNITLSGWLTHSQKESRKIIIILHGYPAEKSDMLSIASALYPDFSLLLLDLRHFGNSEGAYTTLGVKERGDMQVATDFVKERGYEHIGVFGFSLGGAIGIVSAAEDDRINAVASYAVYSDLRHLGWESYRVISLLKYPLVELMNLWSKMLFGTSVASLSPEQAAVKLNIPVFIIHTKQDEQIAFSHAKRLERALEQNSKAEFYFPEQGFHGELPLDFNDRLRNFFRRKLSLEK